MMHADQPADVPDDRREIGRVLGRFAQAFAATDTAAFLATWDDTGAQVVYQPEERLEPLFTIEAVREYMDELATVLAAVRDVSVLDSRISVYGDVATAYVRAWCRISFSRIPKVVDGQVRQTFVLRRTPGGWRVLEYHESRQAVGFEEATGRW